MKFFKVIGLLVAACCCWTAASPIEIKDEDLKPEARISEDLPSAQPVEYRADGAGFRVAANNLPVFNPEPVRDTPEVEEAKRKHFEAYQAIAQHIAKSQVAEPQSEEPPASSDPVYVAPLDLEPLPENFVPAKIAAEEKTPAAEIVAPKPEYNDQIIDDAKEAVITNPEQAGDEQDTIFEVDAEPVKLLAQFYSKHLKDNAGELKPIERPAGFHPKNLEIPRGFDIFRRSEGREKDAIVVTNPEYVDLRAFVQTTQFRSGKPEISEQAESSPDLSLSDDMDPAIYEAVVVPQDLLQYYYGGPVAVTREKLPESLKIAAQGLSGIDGQHTAQVAPSQNNIDLDRQRMYRPIPIQRYMAQYSPFSSYYSPYYFFRQPYTYTPFGYYPYYHAIY